MAFMEWSKEYELGIPQMDEQHKMWLKYLNTFYENLSSETMQDNLKKLLYQVLDYTEYHFKQEEQFLSQLGYPALSEQKELHKGIQNTLQQYYSKCLEGRLIISSSVTSEMKKWLNEHILVEDRKYADYYQKTGGLKA